MCLYKLQIFIGEADCEIHRGGRGKAGGLFIVPGSTVEQFGLFEVQP